MYERFTDPARGVVQRFAQEESQRLNHEYVGTEHILLGLLKEGRGVGANVLKNLDFDLLKVRLEVEKLVQSGPDPVTHEKLPQTPRAKKVIEYAMEEGRTLGNYVGTEHLLLGMLREEEGVAAQVLMYLGLKLEEVREEVLNLLGHGMDESDASAGRRIATGPASVVDSRFTDALSAIRHWERTVPAEAEMDPAQGRRYELASLPEDIDYVQFLASEFAAYCQKRQAQQSDKAANGEEERHSEVTAIDEEVERLNLEKEEAVANNDFDRASSLRVQADNLKKKRSSILRELREKAAAEPEPEPPEPEPIALSPASRVHLKWFQAEAAMRRSAVDEAARLVEEIEAQLADLLAGSVRGAVEQLLQRLELVEETIDAETVQKARADLERLRADTASSPKDLALQLAKVRDDVHRTLFDRPKVVFKVNVFKHGVRAIHLIREGDTVETLHGVVKGRYAAEIDEYLFDIHKERVAPSEVRVRVFADAAKSTDPQAELPPQLPLAEIPSRDTEGVTCYPEWTKAKSEVYSKELHG